MIARIWHGYTTEAHAANYKNLLQSTILPTIEQEHGCSIHLFVRNLPQQNEVEFITVCYFASIEQIKNFAGEDYELCVVPPEARAILKRFDERSQHYEVQWSPKSFYSEG